MSRRTFYRDGTGSGGGNTSTKTSRAGLVAEGVLDGAGLDSVAFTEDTSTTLSNPERGFFQYSETHYLSDNTGHVALDAEAMASDRTSLGRTLVFRYLFVEKWRTVDTISQTYLDLLAADLAAARTAGVKLILRFAYADSGTVSPYNSDTTPARTTGHIEQLAPVLNDYADVIFAVEAGFVGTWGEWYYSDNFGSDTGQPWVLNGTDWTNRQSVVEALLNGLDERIFILLRFPGTKDHFYPHPSAAPATRRIGWHNDSFLGPFEDNGTYTSFTDMDVTDTRAYVAFEVFARALPNGGESAQTNAPDSEWTNALSELIARGFVFLNPLYHPDVLSSWGANIDIAKRRLGYRLVGAEVRSQETVAPGGTLRVELDVSNDGFACPNSPRTVHFVLAGSTRLNFVVPVDIRGLMPGEDYTLWAELPVPSSLAEGEYDLALWLPDRDPSLSIRPEYSIRLANSGVWDASAGYNVLRTVTVAT